MDSYEDLITNEKQKYEMHRTIMPIFFFKPNESFDLNYTLTSSIKEEDNFEFPKFPFPTDFENYEKFSNQAKNWMDSILSHFLHYSGAPILPVPTTLFYRSFNLEFWPRDKDTLRTLAKKLGPLLLPLRPNNLLELENKVFNCSTNITNANYNSSEEDIFQDDNNFSEPDYNGRPLSYKYHFVQNDFFQLVLPEPIPECYDTFEEYNVALNNWYKITNEKYPEYKKIKKVEEIGNELGIKASISSPSAISSFSGRSKIDKNNEECRKKLFNKDSKTCSIEQLNEAFNVTLSKTEFDRLTSIDIQSFQSKFDLFSHQKTLPNTGQMTKINSYCFDEETFELLREMDNENIALMIDDSIEFGPIDYITKFPIQNYDIQSQFIFVEPNKNIGILQPAVCERAYYDFPLFLLNNESPSQFIQYCEECQIDFSLFIKTSDDFVKFIKLCDPSDMILSQKFVYVFKYLFSLPSKFEIYVKPLIGSYNKNDCYQFDMKSYEILRTFMRIVESSNEFCDDKISRMMYNLNIQIDEESFANPKKKSKKDSSNLKDFNHKEILNIYKLCARCASLYTFTNLFSFKKWNSNIIFEYISNTVLNPLLFQLSKKINLFRNDIITCYTNDIIDKLDKNIKKANQNAKNNDQDDSNIGNKLMSFSSAFMSFSEAAKTLSEQFVIPRTKSQLRIPIFVLNQDGNSEGKVSTIDDAQINDNQDKTLSMIFSNKSIPLPQQPSERRPSLIDNDYNKNDSNLSPVNPQYSLNDEEPANFKSIIQNIDNGVMENFSALKLINKNEKDEVENTINSLQNSICSMTQSFKTLPKAEANDDNANEKNNEEDDYMKILSKSKSSSSHSNSTSSENKKSKRKKKKKSKSAKRAKSLAYRIIFLVVNMDYPNLHLALFHPSPINFFNDLSKLENGNAFMNLAGGFASKTEKLKSAFLYSDAFKNLIYEIINFDIPKLEISMINFAKRALILLNQTNDRLFSRSQITSLLKSFTSNVPSFNFILCPTISYHFKNKDKFLYTSTTANENKNNSNLNSINNLNPNNLSLLASTDQNYSSFDSSRKTPRKSPFLNSHDDQFDIGSEPSVPIISSDDLSSSNSSLRSSFRQRKEKSKSGKKRTTFDDYLTSTDVDCATSTPNINQFESKAKSFDAHGPLVPDLDSSGFNTYHGNTNDIRTISSLSSSASPMSFRRDAKRQTSRRKNTDSIFGLKGIRLSMSFSVSDSDNSDSFYLAREEEIKQQQQPLKPQYAGEDWLSDGTMLATYLASLVYSVKSSCFPYLLRSVDLLFVSSRIIFPRKFWGTFCGALSVAEVNSWIFLRTIFKLGFVQVLPVEFSLFFPAVFNYKCPYISDNNEEKNESKPKSSKDPLNSTSASGLTFEKLNHQVEKAKQLSLKVMMFSAAVTSAMDTSLQYLDNLLMNDKNHLQKIFFNSVNPSIKIEKLSSSNNKKQEINANDTKSSINFNLYSSSYQASLRNIVQRNKVYYKKIVDKLKCYGNRFQNLISMFPT